ncbi:MAG: hypothetical protein J6T99_10140 [Oscillospiraceae bacterium]|nr:hypothetical protein [Oscillospiraceae bacterium]
MEKIFSVQDRENAFNFVLSAARECKRIVALVQVGSGAQGYHDEWSDLDFVIALDSGDAMAEVMAYMHQKISGEYRLPFFNQDESRHLQCFLLSNLLEIDIGYGTYEHAAALKPAFRVLYDHSGVVEEKMVSSRAWMDDRIYGEKQRKDMDATCRSVWIRLMHAAVAIHRGQYFRAVGELETVRRQYIDLLGDRYRLESSLNREIDRLPETEKAAIRSTFVTEEDPASLWTILLNLTKLIYQELDGCSVPVTQDMLAEYYKNLRS